MNDFPDFPLTVETTAKPEDIRVLSDVLYEFNSDATGIRDGELLCLFLRNPDGAVVGGIYGWTWGGACYIRTLFVPKDMRGRGQGTRLMREVEKEAMARGCRLIVLETHDFQAPGFYMKFGFETTGCVEGYPRGHSYLTMVKRLGAG
jgi:ribosomal protein S18 acetylase RimI-like enzyme